MIRAEPDIQGITAALIRGSGIVIVMGKYGCGFLVLGRRREGVKVEIFPGSFAKNRKAQKFFWFLRNFYVIVRYIITKYGRDKIMQKQLTAIIEKEGDGYVSFCPEYDIASQGGTVEEARNNLHEALELFFETAFRQEIQSRFHGEIYITRMDV